MEPEIILIILTLVISANFGVFVEKRADGEYGVVSAIACAVGMFTMLYGFENTFRIFLALLTPAFVWLFLIWFVFEK